MSGDPNPSSTPGSGCAAESIAEVFAGRLRLLRSLTVEAVTAEEAAERCAESLAAGPHHVAFALIYLADADALTLRLGGAAGLEAGSSAAPIAVDGRDLDAASGPIARVARSGRAERTQDAWILPLAGRGPDRPAGAVVLGVSPDRPFDEDARVFFELIASTIAGSVTRATLDDEGRRAQMGLAELRAEMLEEIARKDREIEAFAYSASHDLRAPLRGIDGFSQVLLEDHYAALDDEGKACLQRVRAATQRMGALIDDLLQLSRVDRAEMRRAPVDLSRVAQRIGRVLSGSDRPLDFVVAEGLVADGDAPLLKTVFEHLLGNAWKFTSKTAAPRVEVGSTQANGQTVFFVRDNGAGFDSARSDRLFSPFRRLHSQNDFPGTGVGLATVRRIIDRHGGRVWAEARVNEGATISFTLDPPKTSRPPAAPRR